MKYHEKALYTMPVNTSVHHNLNYGFEVMDTHWLVVVYMISNTHISIENDANKKED